MTNNKGTESMLDLKNFVKRCQNGEQFEYLLFWGHTPTKDGKITKACFRRIGDSPRDTAKNRDLHMDQYCLLILMWLYNPILSSMRGLQEASNRTCSDGRSSFTSE